MSAFKQLYSAMINSGGNLSAVRTQFGNKKIKCMVKESFPHFLVTDVHFYVPCYFTKGAVDGFKSKHSGVNISDLKSKVIEIGDWSLEMHKVDSASVFTSYAGIEIRLIVNSFSLVTSKDKIPLNKYPVNLYRDDEIKTLFQAHHHKTLASRVPSKDSLPDVSKKGDSVVSFATGNKFQYNFKTGSTAFVSMESIFRSEKGANALKNLGGSSSGPGAVRVSSKVKASKPSAKKASGLKVSSKTINKSGANPKQSVARVGGKSVPKMMTPNSKGSGAQSAAMNRASFSKMKAFLKSKKK